MDSALDDCFVVFARADHADGSDPEAVERPLASCASYEEARQVCQAYHDHATDCVIRYVGPAGGGD